MQPIKETTSVCSTCLTKVPALVFEEENAAYLEKTCPEHGKERALLASDVRHYYRSGKGEKGGCGPAGCGVLNNHSCTMIFEITEHCNLSCPTCFAASSPEQTWRMGLDEFETKLDRLVAAGKRDADIVQLSGGEPTTHPDLEKMVDLCFEKGIAKVYINSNGIRFGKEPELLERLAKHKENLQIYLQFDGTRPTTYDALRGAKGLFDLKMKALDNAIANGIYVLPVMAVTRDVNMDEIGTVLRLLLERHPHLNGVMLQPAFYAGRYLNEQHQQERVTISDIISEVEEQTKGMFTAADFGPIPCSDPNCFSLAVGMVSDGKVIPISRYFPSFDTWEDEGVAERIASITDKMPQNMLDELADDELVDQLLDMLTQGGDDGEVGLRDYRDFFIVGIKPFMDAATFDQDRVEKCCTHVIDREGNPVSLCEYNTIRRPKGLV
jgi:7,8-dihydro-6-hydroxymethylpterin dimethyltransferase